MKPNDPNQQDPSSSEPAKPCSRPAHCSAEVPHEGIWRCTADDDKEKEWDSTTALDALLDAEQAIADGALKVVIQRISPPNAPDQRPGAKT